jgi:hypothetical protein
MPGRTPDSPAEGAGRGPVWDLILNVLQIIGAGAAFVGWITIVGGARVWARFDAAGVPSPVRSVTAVPRESLFAEGLHGLAGPIFLAAVASVAVYAVLARRNTKRTDAAAKLEELYGELYAARARGGAQHVRPGDDPLYVEYAHWRDVEHEAEARKALATVQRLPPPISEQPPVTPARGSVRRWASRLTSPLASFIARAWRRIKRPRWYIPIIVVLSAIAVWLVSALSALTLGESLATVIAIVLILIALVALLGAVLRPEWRSRVRDIVEAWWWLGLVITVILSSLVLLMDVVANLDFEWAFLWVLSGAVVLMTLVWLARITTPLRTAATMFALLTGYFGILGFLREWNDDTPALDPVRVLTKDPADDIRGRYIARLDGDIYVATRQARDANFRVTVIPKERVKTLFVGPSGQIAKLNTPAGRTHEPAKNAKELAARDAPAVRCEPVYPLDENDGCARDATGADTGGEDETNTGGTGTDTGGGTPSRGGQTDTGSDAVPLPDYPEQTLDTERPDVTLPQIDSIALSEDGSFLFEWPAFRERVTGVMNFITQQGLDVPAAAGEGAQHVRVLLGTLPFLGSPDKRVLVRVRLSGVARRLVEREKALPVVVRLVALDDVGNTNRELAQMCFILRAAQDNAGAKCAAIR